jgi:hypothetical protein
MVKSLIVTLLLFWAAGGSPMVGAQAPAQRDLKKTSAPESVKSDELFSESHALIFGVSDYNNGLKPLPGVKNDVAAVSQALHQQGFTVKIVMNPTQPKFAEEIRLFISQHGLKENNRLLVYYAGHGHTIESPTGAQGYLVPVDAPHPDRDEPGFINSAISFDEIQVYSRRIRSKYALFVFDSCFSGSLFDVRGNAGLPPPIASIAGLPIRQFIASGSAKQTVPDKSIFCRQFVEALNGAADIPPQDGYITGTELGFYLHRTVTTYTANASGKPMQTPQYGKLRDPDYDKGEFIFILPGFDRSKISANPLPAPAPAAITSSPDVKSVSEPTRTTFPFSANSEWSDSGLRVQRNQQVEITITYSGVRLGKFGDASPEGVTGQDDKRPLKSCPTGATIVRIGGASELICARRSTKFTAPQDGVLQFSLNEQNLKDNFGTVLAKVIIYQ